MVKPRRLWIAMFGLAVLGVGLAQRPGGAGEIDRDGSEPPAFTEGTTVLEGADMRPQFSLDGEWHSIPDPYFNGLYSFHHQIRKDGYFLDERWKGVGDNRLVEYDFPKSPTLKVPGDWNTQRDALFLYEGPLWYEREFTWSSHAAKKVFLHVGAANYRSYFWVNGKKLCQHEGGFTTFDCEATSALKDGNNSIVAAVDSTRMQDGVPTLQTDWWNYGGLTRSIALVEVPQVYITGYDLHLDRSTRSRAEGWVRLAGGHPGEEVTVSIPDLKASTVVRADESGLAKVSMPLQGLTMWSPESPKLYAVELRAGSDSIHEQMGFKTFETRGSELLLNGKPVFLRGMSVHAEAPYRTGRAWSTKDAETMLGWAKELGCNYLRLAHYPHGEAMTRAADRMGVLLWSEIPTYWALSFDNPTVLEKARQQLQEEIARDRNKASVALWSIANETPNTPARVAFLTELAREVHRLDPERPVTAALLVHNGPGGLHDKQVDDPLGRVLDVIGINEYIGWYEGKPEDMDATRWTIGYDKPVLVSEFGGDAKAGLHGKEDQRWTEEYQGAIYRHALPMFAKVPQIRGMSPWILMDFRSPRRELPGVQDLFNRKGLVSDQGEKKLGFGVLQQAYKGGYGKAE